MNDNDPKIYRPYGVQAIGDIYGPNAYVELPDGRVVAACGGTHACGPLDRLRAAWWVLSGRAVALVWPREGEVEAALGAKTPTNPSI